VVGFAVQWLRQYPWFSDGWVLLLSLVGGALCALMSGATGGLEPFLSSMFSHTLMMLGGTALGHGMSHLRGAEKVVPKFKSNGGEGA